METKIKTLDDINYDDRQESSEQSQTISKTIQDIIDKKVAEKISDLESELAQANAEKEEALKYKNAYNRIKEIMQDDKCKNNCIIYQTYKRNPSFAEKPMIVNQAVKILEESIHTIPYTCNGKNKASTYADIFRYLTEISKDVVI